jgi:hypothetical protein
VHRKTTNAPGGKQRLDTIEHLCYDRFIDRRRSHPLHVLGPIPKAIPYGKKKEPRGKQSPEPGITDHESSSAILKYQKRPSPYIPVSTQLGTSYQIRNMHHVPR